MTDHADAPTLCSHHSVLSVCSVGLICFLAISQTVRAGVVEDWNAAFIQAVRKETPPPCLVSRNLPIFHLCIHRAVQDALHAGLDEPSQQQAALHAGELAFKLFFPSQLKLCEGVCTKHADRSPPASQPQAARPPSWLDLADAAVKRTFKARENDGASTTIHYVPKNHPGQWQRTPPKFRPPEFPHWGMVQPFVLEDVTQFRAPPPLELNSEDYAADVNEVRQLGGKISTQRTAEQTLIARFWADFSYTTSPAGHWNDIARSMSLQRKLSTAEAARLFAILDMALADTCIVIWDTKYHYNFWRPLTAIQRADEDDNAATTPDKTWEPLLVNPPHPEYVSGHSGISGAAATILEHFFGTDGIRFSASSDDVKDTQREFISFQACAEEVARSRVYGGIHFSSAGREGLTMGRKVATFVLTRCASKTAPN